MVQKDDLRHPFPSGILFAEETEYHYLRETEQTLGPEPYPGSSGVGREAEDFVKSC